MNYIQKRLEIGKKIAPTQNPTREKTLENS